MQRVRVVSNRGMVESSLNLSAEIGKNEVEKEMSREEHCRKMGPRYKSLTSACVRRSKKVCGLAA